ncbi:MAG: WD40/YVTN/BNR-like repeat-containing protein [Thermoanaerobaculales bacterium]
MVRLNLSLPVIAVLVVTVLSSSTSRTQGCTSWQVAQVTAAPAGLAAVTWANGQFWAFGTTAYGSATGLSWTALGAGPPMELLQVRWTGAAFIALGRYGIIATSFDGLSWTQRYNPGWYGPPSTALSDVAWNGSTYVAVGFEPTESGGAYGYPLILVSNDLIIWNTVMPPQGGGDREELDGVVWTGTRFVAVGSNYSGQVVFTSDDGRTWQRLSGPGGGSVAWNGQELVAVGGTMNPGGGWLPTVWRSLDGLTWQQTSLDPSYTLRAVTWDGSRFVVVGTDGVAQRYTLVLTSSDGSAWRVEQTSASDSLAAVTSHLGTDVAVGQNGTILVGSCFASEPVYLPAAAHLAGINGSSWRTDLEVHNPGTSQAAYTIELLKRDADNGAADSRSFSLAPGQSTRYSDALGSLFGFTGAATLRVTPFGGRVMTWARSYDAAPAGSYGQSVEGMRATVAIPSGSTARMIGLSQAADRSAGFRTNLGLVSAGPAAMSVVVDFFGADGTMLGELTVGLLPYESVQHNEVFREVTSAVVDDGYIVVKTTTDGGRFFAYATVIDNRSNDPTYVTAR